VAERVGELLFSVVDLARAAGVDPETALRTATLRHRDAVRSLEQQAGSVDGAAGAP